MATSQKIVSLNNNGEQLRDVLPKELTEKLKDGVNAHVTSELSERLDALKKAADLDGLNQITALREWLDGLNKTRYQLSLSLDALKDNQNKIAEIKEQFDAQNKTRYQINVPSDALKDAKNKIAAIMERQNTMKIASKTLLSFNLFPIKSFESNLKNINYPNSIEHALARDWQKVGNDLWKSYLKISSNQLSDNDE